MNVAFVEIQNFRKHKACRLKLDKAQTILVGANNSGKTSAIDAMILFLKKSRRKDIATTDFTLSNWSHINQIGTNWIKVGNENQLLLPILLAMLKPVMIIDIYNICHSIIFRNLPELDLAYYLLIGIKF